MTIYKCAQVISTEPRQFESWVLTWEGSEVVEQGSHEARLFEAVDVEAGTPQADVMVRLRGAWVCKTNIPRQTFAPQVHGPLNKTVL